MNKLARILRGTKSESTHPEGDEIIERIKKQLLKDCWRLSQFPESIFGRYNVYLVMQGFCEERNYVSRYAAAMHTICQCALWFQHLSICPSPSIDILTWKVASVNSQSKVYERDMGES